MLKGEEFSRAMRPGSVVLGLDPATVTGYAVSGITQDGRIEQYTGEIKTVKEDNRMARWARLAAGLRGLLAEVNPDLVVIEGYSMGSRHMLVTMVEVGLTLRATLHEKGSKVLEVAPQTLKKFVTGKGNAKKEDMKLHLYKRWQFEVGTDNEADALCLALLGLCYKGLLDSPVFQTSITDGLRSKFEDPETPYMRALR